MAKAIIKANFKPDHFYDDVCCRKVDQVPRVQVYATGFSCKPWSRLNHALQAWSHPESKVMTSILRYVRTQQPTVCILENVLGLGRVLPRVLASLRNSGYEPATLLANPAQLGEPIQRPRYYIMGIRKDVALAGSEQFQSYARAVWEHLTANSSRVPLPNRTLAASHPLILQHFKSKESSKISGKASKGEKWKRKHCEFLKSRQQHGNTLIPPASALKLTVAREVALWNTIRSTLPKQYRSLALDASQSIERCGARTDGSLPTITPQGRIVSSDLRRELVPEEKIILHAYPLHRLKLPPGSCSPAQLSSMGGNGMHCVVFGSVLLLVLSAVDWRKQASLSQDSLGTVPAAKVRRKLNTSSSPPIAKRGSSSKLKLSVARALRRRFKK